MGTTNGGDANGEEHVKPPLKGTFYTIRREDLDELNDVSLLVLLPTLEFPPLTWGLRACAAPASL